MTKDDKEIVSALRSSIADRVGRERMELWLGHEGALRREGGCLIVSSWDDFSLERLRRQLRDDISAAAQSVLGDQVTLEFRIDATLRRTETVVRRAAPQRRTVASSPDQRFFSFAQDAANSTATAVATPPSVVAAPTRSVEKLAASLAPPTETPRTGRKFAKFETFVMGDGNRIAHAAAQTVAQRLGEISPLYLHGPTGCGKTHLLEGAWSLVRRSHPEKRCVYLAAEQFTTMFLEALQGKGLPNFRRKLRDADLLIVDDLQFLSGKKATLQELLNTVDAFAREHRQLVLAADRPPEELTGLGMELSARLSCGIVAEMKPAEEAIRHAVVQRSLGERKLHTSTEIIALLARELPGDGRRIQGAINLLAAVREATGKPLTEQLVRETLKDRLAAAGEEVRLLDIERTVCELFGLPAGGLQAETKSRSITQPRMLAMWLARKYTRAGLSEISGHFGLKSHSTVVAAQRKVSKWLTDDESMKLPGGGCPARQAVERAEQALRTRRA